MKFRTSGFNLQSARLKTITSVTVLRPHQRGARTPETKVESSKTIVMLAMITGSTTLKEEMANRKAILENLPGRAKKRKHVSIFKKKRLLN